MEALSSRLPPRQIVAGINARFFRGRPSTSLAEAGVLIHIFDNQGDLDGHMYERPGFSETFYSTSVITYRKPQIWNSRKHEDGGLIMAANTEILCGFDHDQGTGGQRNGGCPESWSPEQTLQVLRSGEPATAYWINEFHRRSPILGEPFRRCARGIRNHAWCGRSRPKRPSKSLAEARKVRKPGAAGPLLPAQVLRAVTDWC